MGVNAKYIIYLSIYTVYIHYNYLHVHTHPTIVTEHGLQYRRHISSVQFISVSASTGRCDRAGGRCVYTYTGTVMVDTSTMICVLVQPTGAAV